MTQIKKRIIIIKCTSQIFKYLLHVDIVNFSVHVTRLWKENERRLVIRIEIR